MINHTTLLLLLTFSITVLTSIHNWPAASASEATALYKFAYYYYYYYYYYYINMFYIFTYCIQCVLYVCHCSDCHVEVKNVTHLLITLY